LAHHLNLSIVAEGVETSDQLQTLAELGCDMVQGYYLCRPLPGNKIVTQFSRKNSHINSHHPKKKLEHS
jgi:EAL domain-containing protein (putative c-di-GMP-specific phosphodiesterase class I)